MVNVAVIYYSSTGNVYRLAAAAAAAAEKEGAQVRLARIPELVTEPPTTDREAWRANADATREIPEVTLADLQWADALLFGSPVHFGHPAPQVLHFLDTTAMISIAGELSNKVVSAFSSGSAPHGGQVSTILGLYNTFCHWGSLIVATGSTDEVLFRPTNGNPYGASNVSRNIAGNVDDDNIAAVEFQTRRVIAVATAYTRGLRQTD